MNSFMISGRLVYKLENSKSLMIRNEVGTFIVDCSNNFFNEAVKVPDNSYVFIKGSFTSANTLKADKMVLTDFTKVNND